MVFLAHGVLMASWISRIPAVQQKLHLTTGALGAALLGIALGAILGMPLATWITARRGSRAATIAGLLVWIAALPIVGAMPSLMSLACALLLLGIGLGVTDVSMNAQAVLVEQRHGRSIMSSFHGFWSIGAFAGAAAGGFCAGPVLRLTVEVHLAAAALIVGGIALAAAWLGMIPAALDLHASAKSPSATPAPAPVLARAPRLTLPPLPILALAAASFSSMLAEGAMGDWGALYLRRQMHASEQIAADGYSVFAFAMAAMRFAGDSLTRRFGPARLTRACGLLITIGLGLAVGTATVAGSMIGYALTGIGTSVVVPLVFSAAGRWPSDRPAATLAVVTSTAYLCFLVGPPLIGFVAELIHLRWALALVAAFGLPIVLLARYTQIGYADAPAPGPAASDTV